MAFMKVLSQATNSAATAFSSKKAGKNNHSDDTKTTGFEAILAGLVIPADVKGLDSGCKPSQNDFPAGKEANSGGIQGTLSSGNGFSLTGSMVLGQNGTAAAGMLADLPKDNSELDQYKQKIADMLENLSGQIKIVSSEKSMQQRILANDNTSVQETLSSLIPTWLTEKSDQNSGNGNSGSATANTTGILGSLQKNIQGTLPVKLDENGQGAIPVKLNGDAFSSDQLPEQVSSVQHAVSDGEVGGDSTLVLPADQQGQKQTQEVAVERNNEKGNSIAVNTAADESQTLKDAKDEYHGTASKKEKVEFGTNDGSNSSQFNGSTGITDNTAKLAATKASTATVLEQIAMALPKHPTERMEVKNLDIQLHPAELGSIRIAMSWEDGMVHLRVQATETSTGTLIQNHLAELRQNLQANGIACGLMQMGMGNDQQNSGRNQQLYLWNTELNQDNETVQPERFVVPLASDDQSRLNVTV